MSIPMYSVQDTGVNQSMKHNLGNTEAITVMTSVASSFEMLGRTFDALNDQTVRLKKLQTTKTDFSGELERLSRRLKDHEVSQTGVLKSLKKRLQGDVSEYMSGQMKEDVRQQVRAEIATQTRQHVSAILPEYIPVSLSKQVEENKQILWGLRTSLMNSESRSTNQMLHSSSVDEPFAPIYMLNGKMSESFPVDLRSLLYYGSDDMRYLMKDYGLTAGEDREANWKAFLDFIGAANIEVASAVQIVQRDHPCN